MKNIFASLSLLFLALISGSVDAASSTINPAIPAQGSTLSSSPIRANFLAAYNDINTLYGLVNSGGGANPGGLANQIQYNNGSGGFGGFTMSGDCTVSVSTGAINCTKLNGVSPSAFTVAGVTGETFPASGLIVGTTDAQTLTNKTINGGSISGATITGATFATTPTSLAAAVTTKSQYLLHYMAGMGAALTGVNNVNILHVGDSIDYSLDSAGGQTAGTNQRVYSVPGQFATLLAAKYGANAHVSTDAFFGYNIYYQGSNQYDTRLTLGSATDSGLLTLGGDLFDIPASAATPLTYTSFLPINQCDIYYYGIGGGGVATAHIGSGTAVTTSTNLGNIITKATITSGGSAAVQALSITWSSGGDVLLAGAECYDNAKKWIIVINAGMPGRTGVTQATDNTGGGAFYNPGDFGNRGLNYFLSPIATFIEFGVNDFQGGNTTSAFNTALTALTVGYQGLGSDVILVAPHQIGLTNPNSTYANQLLYKQVIDSVANTNNALEADMFDQMGTFLQAQARGQGSVLDTIHYTGPGYFPYAATEINAVSY